MTACGQLPILATRSDVSLTMRPMSRNEATKAVRRGAAVLQCSIRCWDVMRGLCACRLGLLAAIVVLASSVGAATAQSPEHPRLLTNEAYVEDVTRATPLAIG